MRCLLSYSESPMSEYGSNYEANIKQLEAERMMNQPKSFWKFGYKTAEVDFHRIHEVVQSNYRCYSAGVFEGGKAKNDSWIQGKQNVIILDIDDGLSLDRAKEIFADYKACIITSKSHCKDKNGQVCDRFRVILPLAKPIDCNAETYTEVMSFIMCHKYTFVDKQCKDPARIYFGFHDENTEVYYTTSQNLFCFNEWTEKMEKSKEIHQWCKTKESQIEKLTHAQQKEYADNGTKADWYRANWKTDKILEALKFNEKFYKGGRNGTLFSWAKYLLEEVGLNDSETAELILWVNGQGDGISESEIQHTIFRSLRIAA